MELNQAGPGRWSLSEFLNLVELRSQCWCFVDLGATGGFRIPHSDGVLFYAVLEGQARIVGAAPEALALSAGDMAIVLSGDAHAVRSERGRAVGVLEFLHNGEYVDIPPSFGLGEGAPVARLLCGRLRVRWPGGQHPRSLPQALTGTLAASVVNFAALEQSSDRSGSAALLTQAATLLFIAALRDHPQCEQIFEDSTLNDPVARARQFIQTHPFVDWTVASLARKVGMGRSNFAARFVGQIGRTPLAVLTEERLNHAATFLKRTDLKISEISERIGYRSEAAFSRRFTAHFGVSPGKMRKQWRRALPQ